MSHHAPHFTDQDFQRELHKPELIIGAEVVYNEIEGKIISLASADGDEKYCVLKMKKPFMGCKILQVRKDAFWYAAPILKEGEAAHQPQNIYVK